VSAIPILWTIIAVHAVQLTAAVNKTVLYISDLASWYWIASMVITAWNRPDR